MPEDPGIYGVGTLPNSFGVEMEISNPNTLLSWGIVLLEIGFRHEYVVWPHTPHRLPPKSTVALSYEFNLN